MQYTVLLYNMMCSCVCMVNVTSGDLMSQPLRAWKRPPTQVNNMHRVGSTRDVEWDLLGTRSYSKKCPPKGDRVQGEIVVVPNS